MTHPIQSFLDVIPFKERFIARSVLMCDSLSSRSSFWVNSRKLANQESSPLRRCGICGEMIPRTPLNINKHPHYASLHQDYLAWGKTRAQRSRLFAIGSALILIVSFFSLAEYGYRSVFLIEALLVAAFAYYQFFWVGLRGLRRFAREWKKKHPNGLAS